MESSLSILKPNRLQRLRETNCVYVAPGIESWVDYTAKSGAGSKSGEAKLDQVAEHFHQLGDYVPGMQANFLFGSDEDVGAAPAELTKAFIERTPRVWPTINIPTPFGATPLRQRYAREGRILKTLPFAFYYNPLPCHPPEALRPGHLLRPPDRHSQDARICAHVAPAAHGAVASGHPLHSWSAHVRGAHRACRLPSHPQDARDGPAVPRLSRG